MSKPRQFRPAVSDAQLEERVVMSITASQVPAAILIVPAHIPVATSSQVMATVNQLHSSLLSYQSSVTNAVLYAESQITAGKITQGTAINLLFGYLGNKGSLLNVQGRLAAGNLPYGSGFNGYVNSTKTAIGDLPSGSSSLYSLLTYPSATTTGPIITLQNNVFTAISTGNFSGALQAVNSAAIHSNYAQMKSIVLSYVVNGVKAHDFSYHS